MLQLLDYQEKGADFIYEHDRSLILIPAGGKKTAMVLTAMADMLRDGVVKRWLVIAPNRVARETWPVEIEKWVKGRFTYAIAVGSNRKTMPKKQRDAVFASKVQVVIFNYDNIQTIPDLLSFDGIVFDELTKLKNPSGLRFKHLFKAIAHIDIRVGLTGSFTSNGLEDTFGQCKIVDQSLLGKTKGAFMQQYFILINREYGQWMPRKGSLEAVMARIKPAVFTIDDSEYKNSLPPLQTVEIRCDLEDRRPYDTMKKAMTVELQGKRITAASASAVLSKLKQGSSGFFYKTEALPGNGKMVSVKTPVWFSKHKFDRLEELLQENQREPTMIFYMFVEELEELKRRYPHAQTLDDRDAVARWNRGEIELLLAHPQSAQYGLNLQEFSNKIVFLSLTESLINFEQAIARILRSGQKHDRVWLYIMMTNNTNDDRMLKGLKDKQDISSLAFEALQ